MRRFDRSVFEETQKHKRARKSERLEARKQACEDQQSFPLLFRAKTNKKKVSTLVISPLTFQVSQDDLVSFYRKLRDV